MISLKSTPTAAFVMIFGFASNVQFGMIANTLASADRNTEKIAEMAKRLAQSVSERDSIASVACRLVQGEALLVCIPVDEPESARAGRKGLSVVYAVAATGRKRFTANMLVQFLAAVDIAVSSACKVDAGDPTTTAAILTRRLQKEKLGTISDAVTHAVLDVASIFSMLISGASRRRLHARFSSSDATWHTFNYGTNTLVFDLAELAMRKLGTTRTDQLAQYFPFTPNSPIMSKNVYSGRDDRDPCGYRFVENGILLTFPFTLPKDF